MQRFARLATIAALGACLWTGAARADQSTTKAAADALFREAITLAERGEVGASVEKFKASYALDPARGTLQGLAMAEEKLGRLLDAYLTFQRLLEAATAAGDTARADFARERLAVLKVRVPTLVIELGGDVPRGTKLTLDGDTMPAGAVGSALPINPGDHRVVAVTPDGRRFSRMIGVSEGARARLRVSWVEPAVSAEPKRAAEPAPVVAAEEPDRRSSLTWAGLVLGAGAVAFAGAGTYLWFDAGSDYDAVEDACPNKQCPPSAEDRIDSGQTKETWSQVLWVAGGVAAATSVTLLVLGRSGSSEARVSASAGPTGLYLHGRF